MTLIRCALWLGVWVAAMTGCRGESDDDASIDVVGTVELPPPPPPPPALPQFADGVVLGVAPTPPMREASGLAAGRRNPGVLWTHNDGTSPRFIALSESGVWLGTFTLPEVAGFDFEDIAIGPGPTPGVSYVYLADIGTNTGARPFVTVYRIPEPLIDRSQPPVQTTLTGAVALEMSYSGRTSAPNAETLLVDPVTADLYLVTKSGQGTSGVYRNPFPQDPAVRAVMPLMATLTLGTEGVSRSRSATGGDISPAGDLIAIRTYTMAYLWQRPAGTDLWDAFSEPGLSIPLADEPLGEAIAFAADGQGYFTVSEGTSQPIYFFARME